MKCDCLKVGQSKWADSCCVSSAQSARGARTQVVRYLTLARGSNHSRNPGGIV